MQENFTTIQFKECKLHLLDQRLLPTRVETFVCSNYREVEFAIRDMVVRGAPAIGATAAYGMVMAARELIEHFGEQDFRQRLQEAADFLDAARPTAVNLQWALKRMLVFYDSQEWETPIALLEALRKEADAIYEEDIATNRLMGKHGNELIPQRTTILTHCNTGALATAGWGTALGVIKEAFASGKEIFVYADETRPRLQGARLTAWELHQAQIPFKLISDSVAATLIRDGKIDAVIVGADRVAANGDVCNKIGTFMLSALCKVYQVPFYSAFPVSTIDFSLSDGSLIPIEERSASEVTEIEGVRIAPEGIEAYNPAFDVTPHANMTALITEKGVIWPPFKENLAQLLTHMEQK